jgi:benzodiazapine receptor
MRTRLRELPSVLIAIGIPLAIGAVGGIATSSSLTDWYPALVKPAWNPPNWVFGPVWTLLYIVMGIAAWRVWRTGTANPGVRRALGLFGIQLLFNLLWSLVFFGLRQPGWALVEIVVAWVLILSTLVAFYRLDRAAGVLLIPYQLWVTFATALNAAIWWLNR